MKHKISLLIALCLSFFFAQIILAEDAVQIPTITVKYQGIPIIFEGTPILENGSVLVPFRGIFETLGLKVGWEPTTKRVTGTSEFVKIDMTIGKKTVLVNNEKFELESEPRMIHGVTMVPLRFVSESTGKKVSWDPATDTVLINKQMEVMPPIINYGEDSYYPSNLSNKSGIIKPYIFEKDGFLYLLWTENSQSGSYLNVYYSLADMSTGKWVYQNQQFKNIKKDNSFFQYFFHENAIYWRAADGVLKSTFERGTVTQEVYVANKSTPKGKEFIAMARYDGKNGLITGVKDSYYLYSEEVPNGLFKISDLNNILLDYSSSVNISLDQVNKNLRIISNNAYKTLNYESGDISYENGKDKVERLRGSSYTQPCYYNGKLYYLFQEGQDGRIKLGSISASGQNELIGLIDIKLPAALSEYKLTLTESELHLWRNTEFNRLPSIDLIRIIK
ncbi:copper amine oxidase N-terminal domain-containing protein [Paenibacillus agricola]|uniref:Copper amine oxidase N-terminal domain-containing protein n=1 Tax=Paenibacillus agricola TaxID=2716264 RepID=A0ABX0JAM4_9BACL|nr:copper amine oxidase N-terminal domain-containing protein [Paenibacillus agricola]NHN33197.1 copper amine oxidase N-terminal domain-containing protein [Paenibacillus agricola]